MRKRFVTTLIIGILAVACALGFTACDDEQPDLKIPMGEEVTEEIWKAALEAPINTLTYMHERQSENKNDNYRYHFKSTYYLGTESSYGKDIAEDSDYGMETSEYYAVIQENVVWDCVNSEYLNGEEGWHANKTEYANTEVAKQTFGDLKDMIDFSRKEWYPTKMSENINGFESLIDLYSEFTYSNGKYSAKLYGNQDSDALRVHTVELSFKDGKVFGYSNIVEGTNIFEGNGQGGTYFKYTTVYSNFNQNFTVPAPQGALDAIKAEQNK